MENLFSGLKVIEVASFVFAPGAGTVMSDFGADVIHVEPPGIGDPLRVLYKLKPLPECEENYCWMLDARNKKSLVLDLKKKQGHTVLRDLLATADVLITNYQPSVLKDLNLTYETVKEINPRIIFAHATGYGESGDEVEKPGYDATAWWARSGLMDAVRPAGGELALSTAAMGDHPSSMALFGGISAALYAREKTGLGTKVSSSLAANGAWSNSIFIQAALCNAKMYPPTSQETSSNAMLNHYAGSDGRSFFLVLVKEAEEFAQFCTAIGRSELATDPRFEQIQDRRTNSRQLVEILNKVFSEKPLSEWRRILDEHSITFGIISTVEEVVEDPQMHAAGVFQEFSDLPGKKVVASPIAMADYPKISPVSPPDLGEHNEEILNQLGYSEEKKTKLRKAGIFG